MSLLDSENRSALFPLHTVLFPGCRLPLKIFEQRYLRLVKSCLRDCHGFVVILISTGKEVNDTPETYRIGSFVEITDWDSLEDGLLGITIEARYRVRVSKPSVQDDGLMTGQIEPLPVREPAALAAIENLSDLVDTLKQLEQHPYIERQTQAIDYTSATDITNKLSQLLPIDPLVKQSLLEIDTTPERIQRLRDLLYQLQQ